MLFDLANLPYWIVLAAGAGLLVLAIAAGDGDDEHDPGEAILGAGDEDGGWEPLTMLSWLGFGRVPLLLLLAVDLSLWGLGGWMLNLLLGSWLGAMPHGLLAGIVLMASFAIALYSGSLIAKPLAAVFATFGEDVNSDRLIGCSGRVTSATVPAIEENRIGQVDVVDSSGNRLSVNAITPNWATLQPRMGEAIVVIDRLTLANNVEAYVVIVQDSADQERWLHHGG